MNFFYDDDEVKISQWPDRAQFTVLAGLVINMRLSKTTATTTTTQKKKKILPKSFFLLHLHSFTKFYTLKKKRKIANEGRCVACRKMIVFGVLRTHHFQPYRMMVFMQINLLVECVVVVFARAMHTHTHTRWTTEEPCVTAVKSLRSISHHTVMCVLLHALCCKTTTKKWMEWAERKKIKLCTVWPRSSAYTTTQKGWKMSKKVKAYLFSHAVAVAVVVDWNSAIYSLSSPKLCRANLMGVKSKPFNRLFIVFILPSMNISIQNNMPSGVCTVLAVLCGCESYDACDCTFCSSQTDFWAHSREMVGKKRSEGVKATEKEREKQIHMMKNCVLKAMGVNCLDNGSDSRCLRKSEKFDRRPGAPHWYMGTKKNSSIDFCY